MLERKMPSSYDSQPTEYASQEPKYKNEQVMTTTSGEIVTILHYLKEKGLYVVIKKDEPGIVSPAYKINPDELAEIEEKKS